MITGETWQSHSVIASLCNDLKIIHQIWLLHDEVSEVQIVLREKKIPEKNKVPAMILCHHITLYKALLCVAMLLRLISIEAG